MPLPTLDTLHANSSAYTLRTVNSISSDSAIAYSDSESLLPHSPSQNTYGAVSTISSSPSPRRLIVNSTLKMACLFVLSSLFLGLTLWTALPALEEVDRPVLKIPKSFTELQALNTLLNKYRHIYPYRIIICYIVTYLFLQAFSLPGSMYLSILGGAVWGVPRALPLACTCVATGATLCYLISAALGPALLTLPRWQSLTDKWSTKIENQKENILSFLIIIRIAPLPPHWVVNIICPHVGIGIVPFWISTFLGVFGVSVIHTTIGAGLDDMTSADDFHLISWKNFFGLTAIVVGVLIPVGLRYYLRSQSETLLQAEAGLGDDVSGVVLEGEDLALTDGSAVIPSKLKSTGIEEDLFEDDDEDLILEAGPALMVSGKTKDNGVD
jgi:uncharacterized membrane protein YdjX (TVP38/TMEM64 family)